MTRIIWFCNFLATIWAFPLQNPYEFLYPLAYPSSTLYIDSSYNGVNFLPRILPFLPREQYYQQTGLRDSAGFPKLTTSTQSTLNVLAELPYAISKEFSALPLFLISTNALNMVSEGYIAPTTKSQTTKRTATINNSIETTPVVKMVLERPIVVDNLKTDVLFPSEVQIIHRGIKVPLKIGAVIAPVLPDTIVSPESPISIQVVYAVPENPIKITITIEQVKPDKPQEPVIDPVQEAVIVESETGLPPKNITVAEFPSQEAEPAVQVDEDQDGLVNRNPPLPVAPGGIVSSDQPHIHKQPFHNDKESPLLEGLRNPSKVKKS